ncbi:hypothetical protein CALCODRAFT_559032, partial [Calocera cornea HHB12733]
MATSTSANSNAGPTVSLLSTCTPYPLPPTLCRIPTSFTRAFSSPSFLSLSPPVPFDFLGAEETLKVEYVQSVLLPKEEASLERGHWVSEESFAMPGHSITGANDNTARIYSEGLAFFNEPAEYGLGEGSVAARSSYGRSVHLHYIPITGEPSLLTALYTSLAQVSSIAVNTHGSRLVTATWDGLVGLFNTALPSSHELPAEEDAEGSHKKRHKLAPSATDGEE